ncbi:MAG: DUF6252 family protein [Janthinobacterium lividum]
MKHAALPTTALALLLLTQCHKDDPDPLSQLPEATQTGANTFGCLVNGQVWRPGGNDGTSNYSVYYDPTYAQGTLSVATYRLTGNGTDQQIISINSDSMRTTGAYKLKVLGHHQVGFGDHRTRCDYFSTDPGTYCKGSFTITRLDYKAGIVSGTFAFTLYKAGCDTVKVTQGRFDKHL